MCSAGAELPLRRTRTRLAGDAAAHSRQQQTRRSARFLRVGGSPHRSPDAVYFGKVAPSVLSASAQASAPKSSPDGKSLLTVSLFLRRVPQLRSAEAVSVHRGGRADFLASFNTLQGLPASGSTRAVAVPTSLSRYARRRLTRAASPPAKRGPFAESRARTARLTPHMNHQAHFPLELEFIRCHRVQLERKNSSINYSFIFVIRLQGLIQCIWTYLDEA
ncbi:hypothetical protein AOLI_G00306230 [Acnodon oligacanthus]